MEIQSKTITELAEEIIENNNLFFIGTAEFGEVNVPTKITDLACLYSKFGKNGTLIDAIEQLLDDELDAKNIYAVKTTGSHSKAILDVNVIGKDIIDAGVIIKSKNASEIFDDIKITLTNDSITFNFREKEALKYKYSDYNTINNLAYKINKDTNDGIGYVYMETYVDDTVKLAGALDTINDDVIYLHTGDSGLNVSKNELYIALKNTYELLEGYNIDVIVPLNVYLDDINYKAANSFSYVDKLDLTINDKETSFFELLSMFIGTQFKSGNCSIGVIGYNNKTKLSIDEKISILNENKKNISGYISNSFIIVPGNNIYNSKLNKISNGTSEIGYLIRKNNSKDSITSKSLPKFYDSIENFTNEELMKLSENKITSFRYSHYKKRTVIAASTTASDSNDNGYCHMQNIIILQFITKFLKKLCERYIGEDINKLIRNDQIKIDYEKALTELRVLQYIKDFEVEVSRISICEIKIKTLIQSIFTLDFLDLINELKVS